MQTGEDATVITFPTRRNPTDSIDIGAALDETETGLRATVERLRNLSTEVDRGLQHGNLEHVGDPIAFTANFGDLIDAAARTVAVAENQIQAATELWNSESQQQ